MPISFFVYLFAFIPLLLILSQLFKRYLFFSLSKIAIILFAYCVLQLIPFPRIGFNACVEVCNTIPATLSLGFPIGYVRLIPLNDISQDGYYLVPEILSTVGFAAFVNLIISLPLFLITIFIFNRQNGISLKKAVLKNEYILFMSIILIALLTPFIAIVAGIFSPIPEAPQLKTEFNNSKIQYQNTGRNLNGQKELNTLH